MRGSAQGRAGAGARGATAHGAVAAAGVVMPPYRRSRF